MVSLGEPSEGSFEVFILPLGDGSLPDIGEPSGVSVFEKDVSKFEDDEESAEGNCLGNVAQCSKVKCFEDSMTFPFWVDDLREEEDRSDLIEDFS